MDNTRKFHWNDMHIHVLSSIIALTVISTVFNARPLLNAQTLMHLPLELCDVQLKFTFERV